ncbi:hypothetical protein BD410DRAFT_844433 [Rickenella mellea]|uniref:Uncharacterized protein n=1 Tax=Rickenella mellea TaxID=50990 RepID=A0A4Y7PPH3_9AGAM|nr:hypothetical protein BD410DRAFT_844433 [Rickenella mellea]
MNNPQAIMLATASSSTQSSSRMPGNSAENPIMIEMQELELLKTIHNPSTSDLTILVRGLGLRKVVCTLLKIYDGPQNLVLLVNATSEEEASIIEELGAMGYRKPWLIVVGYEMGKKDRASLLKQGGLISVTSKILVVDMLQSDIPTELITGLMVLHAERMTALSLEAFIIRLFREKTKPDS